MSRGRAPEPVQVVKERRDGALKALVEAGALSGFLGIRFDRRGDELTAVLPYRREADRQSGAAGAAWRRDGGVSGGRRRSSS